MAIRVDPALSVAPITLELWHGMIDAGLLEGARVELIEGVMLEMSPNGPLHVRIIQDLLRTFTKANPEHVMDVRVQMPLTIGGSEPEPDLAVAGRGASTDASHPSTAALVVEVAASSHRLDRGLKARLYSSAGVPEYWVVDVPGRSIEVFKEPGAAGYARTERHGPEARLAPAALPSAEVVVGELLPG